MSACNDSSDSKDPFEFRRVFDAARVKHNEMERDGCRWRGIPGEGPQINEVLGGRQKRLLQFQPFIDPRSIGLFFAHELSDLDRLRKARYDLVGLSAHNHHKHGLNATHYEYAALCASKYMPVMAALDRLDHFFSEYYNQFMWSTGAFFNDAVAEGIESEADILAAMGRKVAKLRETNINIYPFTSEFAPFYVMELQKQGVVNLLDPDAHDSVLEAILSSGRLSTSFLSSNENGFSKCPFHPIRKVFALCFDVSNAAGVSLSSDT